MFITMYDTMYVLIGIGLAVLYIGLTIDEYVHDRRRGR